MNTIDNITYFGHAAIFLYSPQTVIAIDPWLLGNPSCPEKFHTPEKLDVIILTHGHEDHAGDTIRLAKNYGSKIYAPYELCQALASDGVSQSQMVGMNKGGSTKFENFTVSFSHAFHSSSYTKCTGETVYAGEPCSVIVNDGKTKFFHAGDTALFSDLKLIGDLYKPDIAFLPIGDCYTMGPEHASIAAQMLGAKLNIPIHHSTFPQLTGTTDEFIKACSEKNLKTKLLTIGEPHLLKSA